jgi:hypothetical protein
VSRELKYLSGEETLNLRRLAYLAQGSTPRVRERLVLYALATGQSCRLKSILYDERMVDELATVEEVLQAVDFDNPGELHWASLPLRYKKALDSFKAAYHAIDTKNESKRLRWERTVRLQKEKGVSNAQIYQALEINAGNVNAYLKNGDIDRVTLDTATNIMKFLFAVQG